jgi:uncharacterized membrane protein
MLFISIKCLHILALLVLFSASLVKNILVWQTPFSGISARWARIADRASGAAAGVAVLSGLGLLWLSGKGVNFYTANALFWLKIAVLLIASALIIRTKLFFRQHANAAPDTALPLPRAIPAILKFDLASLVVMACLGVALASGIDL